MGKLILNGVDYSAPSFSGVSGVKGDKETTYRQGQVNLTPANLGAATEISVNNIINGTTQVGDSGKLGGETAEQWNQKIAEAKPEEIDGILNGTIPVGDSAKLGGKSASEYALDTDLDNYLPLSGGTITGNLFFDSSDGLSRVFNYGKKTYLRNFSDKATQAKFTELRIEDGKVVLGVDKNDGVGTVTSDILHTGNKPTGTYTGNGSASERLICIGDFSVDVYSTIVVSSRDNDTIAIVTREGGAVCVNANGTVVKLSDNNASISYSPSVGAVMTLATNNDCLNANGVSYRYNVS